MSDIIYITMALFIRQDDIRTDLQKRISDDLQAKAKKLSKLTDDTDLVEDSEYIKGTKNTTSLAWVWALIVLAFIAITVWLIITGLAR